MDTIAYDPIGTVASPFDAPDAVPRPADETVDASGAIVLRERYAAGLDGLEAFSHATVLAHLHEVGEEEDVTLSVRPRGLGQRLGIFATSGPCRPNPIAQSVVAIDGVDGARVSVSGIDLIDGTPVLDIRPFAPKDDHLADLDRGWME